MPRRKTEKETDIQKAVIAYLKMKGYLALRLNNIPVPLPSGGFRPVAMRGLPDCHVDIPIAGIPISVWVEFKTKTGVLSEHQKEFQARIHEGGGFYFVVRSIEDMESAIHQVYDEVHRRISNGDV